MDGTIRSTWSDWNPKDYLDEYYSHVGPENRALLEFAVRVFREVPERTTFLDFGGGPTLYSLFPAAPKVSEIHFCDYLEANLSEVRHWLSGDPLAFDWGPFVRATLELENHGMCSSQEIKRREAHLRSRITQVFLCDLHAVPPIRSEQKYDIVVTNFCAESVAKDHTEWRTFLGRIAALVKPQGTLLLSTIQRATGYRVGNKVFPAIALSEADLKEAFLMEGFEADGILIESVPADHPSRLYQGLLFCVGRKCGIQGLS